MRLAKVLVPVALALLLSGSPAAAQGEPPEAHALAHLIFTSGTFDTLTVQVGTTGSRVVRVSVEGRIRRPLSEGEASRLQELFTRVMKEIVSQQEWEALYAALIARHFTTDEIRELTAFYRSPLGVKVLRLSSVMIGEASTAVARLMKSREREFAERFGAEFQREFAALSREAQRRHLPPPIPPS